MKAIEVRRGNYLFAAIGDEHTDYAYVFKWVYDDLRFLYRVDLISSSYVKEQLEAIADKFFENKEDLDYEGRSEKDIFCEMQKKNVRAYHE